MLDAEWDQIYTPIHNRAGGGRHAVLGDSKTSNAILWKVLIFSEEARQVPNDIAECHTDVEWRRISGFRDVLSHGDLRLEHDITADVIFRRGSARH